MTKALCIISW